jgi:hypothetical protein
MAVRAQVAPEAAGDGREHDVVDGPAERVLDRLDAVELLLDPGEAAVRADRHVERARRRAARARQRERADRSHVAEQFLRNAAGAADRGADPTKDLGRHGRALQQRVGQQLRAAWQRVRDPRLFGGRRRRGVGRHVEQDGRDVDAGDPVDECVVRLAEDREAAVFEALDEPQLPQRLVAVELLREGASGEVLELLVAAGRRERVVLDVIPRVEVRVVDPHRPALSKRDERESLAVARHEMQASLDGAHELVVRRRRPVEHHARGDVHVRRGVVLEVQERAVEPGQAVAIGHAAILAGPPSVRSSTLLHFTILVGCLGHRLAESSLPGVATSGGTTC